MLIFFFFENEFQTKIVTTKQSYTYYYGRWNNNEDKIKIIYKFDRAVGIYVLSNIYPLSIDLY